MSSAELTKVRMDNSIRSNITKVISQKFDTHEIMIQKLYLPT